MSEKTEQDFVDEMKNVIHETTHDVSQKVIHSAVQFMQSKGWVTADHKEEFSLFMTKKLPKVIADHNSKKLNVILGLDLEI